MKLKKIFVSMILVASLITPLYSVNAESINMEAVRIYAAGCYEDDIAPILFSWEEILYKGFINRQGELLFYIEWNYEDEEERERWQTYTDWDYVEMNSTTFEDGYSWFEKGEKRYIINTDGEILSCYNIQELVGTGGGYSWVVTKTEPTWNDPGSYCLALHNPKGDVVGSLKIDLSDYSDSEISDVRRELEEECHFRYLGDGVFYNGGSNTFYFLKSGKWIEYNSINNSMSNLKLDWNKWDYFEDIDERTFVDNKYIIDFVDDAILLDSNGEVQIHKLSKEIKSFINLEGISNNYILLNYYGVSPSIYYLYNIQDQKLIKYDGKFTDYIPHSSITHAEMNNDYFALDICGKDDEPYVVLINNDTLEEAFDPVYIKKYNDFTLTEDVLVITNDEETQLIDFDGNIVSSFNSEKEKVIYVGQNTVMCIPVGSDQVNYYNYDGTKLFDEYDFSDAIDLGLLVD